MVSCIFIIEMPPGGQHKKYIHFSVFFWVKLSYTVSGYTIKEMYLNAWNILLCVTKEYTKVVIWEVHICVHIKYISRMMYVIHVLLFWFSAGQFYIDGLTQDCSNSIANALKLLQSCAKPSTYLSKLFH